MDSLYAAKERAMALRYMDRDPGDLIGHVYYQRQLTREPLRYEADRLWVPEGPVLGVTV
jgi:hypothetical protein